MYNCILYFMYIWVTHFWVTDLPADVGDVGSGVALDLLSDEGQIDIRRHLHLPQIDPQQVGTALR